MTNQPPTNSTPQAQAKTPNLMDLFLNEEWVRAAARAEEEAGCDIQAGYTGVHMREFMTNPVYFQKMRQMQAIVLAELRELLNIGWGETTMNKAKSIKRADVINLVHAHQAQLQKLGVKSLNLFGSVARDQATPESDVDILVELDEVVGFFEFFTIRHYLEDILECPIDLGTTDAIKEHLRQPILEEAIRVF